MADSVGERSALHLDVGALLPADVGRRHERRGRRHPHANHGRLRRQALRAQHLLDDLHMGESKELIEICVSFPASNYVYGSQATKFGMNLGYLHIEIKLFIKWAHNGQILSWLTVSLGVFGGGLSLLVGNTKELPWAVAPG